jgi:hypothetical protein
MPQATGLFVLGGITLPDELVWPDEKEWSPVAQESRRTEGGRPVVFAAPLAGGRPITLESRVDRGWLTRAQVDDVLALAALPGASYTLTAHLASYTVLFRHEEPPAVEFQALVTYRVDAPPGDWYTGTIRLRTV